MGFPQLMIFLVFFIFTFFMQICFFPFAWFTYNLSFLLNIEIERFLWVYFLLEVSISSFSCNEMRYLHFFFCAKNAISAKRQQLGSRKWPCMIPLASPNTLKLTPMSKWRNNQSVGRSVGKSLSFLHFLPSPPYPPNDDNEDNEVLGYT